MKWVLIGLVVLFASRGALAYLAESDLRGDAALAPVLSTAPEVQAVNVAMAVRRIAKTRECELDEQSLVIDVGPSEAVPTRVAAGGVAVSSKGPSQRVDLRFTCRRPGVFFVTKDVEVEVHTRAPGDGEANRWPPDKQ